MNDKNIVVILLVLVLGLLVGFLFGSRNMMGLWQGEQHMSYQSDPIIARDGAMQHAMEEMMLAFRGKTGEEYEEVFLKSMIVQHLGAIEMAEGLLEETDRPELEEMAQNMIEMRRRESEDMRAWMEKWFNK